MVAKHTLDCGSGRNDHSGSVRYGDRVFKSFLDQRVVGHRLPDRSGVAARFPVVSTRSFRHSEGGPDRFRRSRCTKEKLHASLQKIRARWSRAVLATIRRSQDSEVEGKSVLDTSDLIA
jgi:hypothetical protein